MSRGLRQRWNRRIAAIVVAAGLMGAAAPRAFAEDGIQNLLSSIFGGGQPQTEFRPQPQDPSAGQPLSRPLTVKLHRQKLARFAPVPTKPEKVSIFEDKTLRRGDAVMTRQGMRIFAGSNTWPYRDDDFVGIADAGRMDKTIQKTLINLDSLPRN